MSRVQAVDVLESLELLGSSQWGLVTAAQAHAAGVSKMQLSRLVERGSVQRVRHGVYALPSADSGPLQGLRAAWLSTGSRPAGHQPLVVVMGESAAAVHGLGDFLPAKHAFVTAVRRQTSQTDTSYRRQALADDDVTWVDGLPVTTVARTVQDLATGSADFDHLSAAVHDAVMTKNVASWELVKALEPAAGRFGSADGKALLAAMLAASDFRPDTQLLEVILPGLQQDLVEAALPQLRTFIGGVLNKRLHELTKHGTQYAAGRQDGNAGNDGTTHSAGSEQAEAVSDSQAHG